MKLPYRILVLDDDENALSGIAELLRDAEYHVTGATTYDAAKQLLAAESYDLFVSDVRLRGYNGLNLVMKSRTEYVRREWVKDLRRQIASHKRFKNLVEQWIDLSIEHSRMTMQVDEHKAT